MSGIQDIQVKVEDPISQSRPSRSALSASLRSSDHPAHMAAASEEDAGQLSASPFAWGSADDHSALPAFGTSPLSISRFQRVFSTRHGTTVVGGTPGSFTSGHHVFKYSSSAGGGAARDSLAAASSSRRNSLQAESLGGDAGLRTPLLLPVSAAGGGGGGPADEEVGNGADTTTLHTEGGLAKSTAGTGAPPKKGNRSNDILFGVINAVVGLPTMISFAAIVFSDPLYKPLLGKLARFSFFSAAMHQIVFTLFSSLPFAVGQPQDVGLIFLSAMATSVADIGRELDLSMSEIVGTALLTMTVATVLVGILTSLVARFKLATLVQYVPLPVVGGYLGYVGYFCLAAGIGLGSGVEINTPATWLRLFDWAVVPKCACTLVAAGALLFVMSHARHPAALPLLLLFIPASFHIYLLATGHTLAEAQDAGWVLKPEGKSSEQFWELYELFNIQDLSFDGVYLPAVLSQLPKMLGLFFVVTFGSCLDVAAIQVDVPDPIDFNSELGTVGLSNIIVGLTGSGYTGSYIFSQTIFSMRAGVSGRMHGVIIAAVEGAVFLLPFSVVQYLPNFFFGALLTVFGIEIAGDWLVRSRSKVTKAEYGLLLATFVAILYLELEAGVAAGMIMCTVYFAVHYAAVHVTSFTVVRSRSGAVRSYRENALLQALGGRSIAAGLSGYVFFGSSTLISDKVMALARQLVEEAHATPPRLPSPAAAAAGLTSAAPALVRATSLAAPPPDAHRLSSVAATAPCFILLDFRRVLGVDATAAQTFGTLRLTLARLGVEMILTRIERKSTRRLFAAHGLISPSAVEAGGAGADAAEADDDGEFCKLFPTLDEGAKYAEDRLLALCQAEGLLAPRETALTLPELLASHLADAPLLAAGAARDLVQAAAALEAALVPLEVAPGGVVYEFGAPSDRFFLVMKGTLQVQTRLPDMAFALRPTTTRAAAPPPQQQPHGGRNLPCGPGAVVGSTDFVLQRPRSFKAQAVTACRLLVVTDTAFEQLLVDCPAAAYVLQAVLLRDALLSEVYALEALDRSALE